MGLVAQGRTIAKALDIARDVALRLNVGGRTAETGIAHVQVSEWTAGKRAMEKRDRSRPRTPKRERRIEITSGSGAEN
jgi:hypothetical protein